MSDSSSAVVNDQTQVKVKSRRGRRILGFVLVLLILVLGLASFLLFRLMVPAGSGGLNGRTERSGLVWVRSIYGMSDAAKDQLERSQAGASAPDGSIWAVDGAHRSLMHFSADGQFLGSTKGPSDKPLGQPGRFAIGPDGTLYVTDAEANAIRVLSSSGVDVGSFGVPSPVSVAVRGDRILVGSLAGFAVVDKKGKPITIVGSRGKGDGQFDYVHGVAFGPDGKIYVVDSFNNRLSAYDQQGKRLWIVRTGAPGNSAGLDGGRLDAAPAKDAKLKGNNALQLPLGLTVDGAGRLVVVDMFGSQLCVFDSKDGSLIAKYGEIGPDDGEFFYPQSVSYDAKRDWFTVADSLNNRIEIVRLPGSSAGNGTLAAARRGLAGPLKACVFPFLLLLIAFVTWFVMRVVRRSRDKREDALVASQVEAENLDLVS